MAESGILILGSARSDGNTARVVEILADQTGFDVLDLNTLEIGYFDYNLPSRNDDFLPAVRTLLQYEKLVFATPVYWYTMSARMKTFFDRISDLTKWHKELGRQLRGKRMSLVSTSGDPRVDAEFLHPFMRTAEYLGMEFTGHLHCEVRNGEISSSQLKEISQFAGRLCDKLPAQNRDAHLTETCS